MKKKNKKNKSNFVIKEKLIKYRCLIIFIIAVIAAEIFVFNFRTFQSMFYKSETIDNWYVTDESKAHADGKKVKFYDNNAEIMFKNVNTEVKNIYIDMESTFKLPNNPKKEDILRYEKEKNVKFYINADDESKKGGISTPGNNIVTTLEGTKYTKLQFTGKSNNVKIIFKNLKDREYIIKNISINKRVPFNFNIIRILFIFLIAAVVYAVRPKSPLYNIRLNLKNRRQLVAVCFIVILQTSFIMGGMFINNNYVYNTYSHHQQYKKLTDAILKGHFYLDEKPDERLETLEDPYDRSERDGKGIFYRWDHAYFEGKYYVYFGIVPVLVFYLPAKLIFNYDISLFMCHLILSLFFVLFCYLLIYEIIKKYYKGNISVIMYLMMAALVVNGSGIFAELNYPNLYYLPIFMGVVVSIMGLYFWLKSIKYNDDGSYKISPLYIALGSFIFSLTAGCRPQMLLGMFLAIPIFFDAVFKDRKLFSKNSIAATSAFVIPVVIVAAFISFYNFSRFGSIFDFGANYNLTTHNMVARKINLGRMPLGIFSYFFQPPNIQAKFPYITSVQVNSEYMGEIIKEYVYGGIMFLQPVFWFFILIPKLKEELKKRKVYYITLMCIIFSLIIVFVDIQFAGILARYYLDYYYIMYIGLTFVIFEMYCKYSGGIYDNIMKTSLSVLFGITLVMSFALFMGVSNLETSDSNPQLFYSIRSMIEFWS